MMMPMLMAGVYIMPLAHTWPDPAEVLVQTSGRNYTVRDYQAFFRDIGFSEVTMISEDNDNDDHDNKSGV